MMIGYVEQSEVVVCGFASDSLLSQKKILLVALKSPMTINELYELLHHISEHNIAPLVAQLKNEGKVFVIGRRLSRLKCGINRHQDIYSSLEEHRPKDFSDSIALLDSIFGVGRVKHPQPAVNARVHICKDSTL